MQKILFNCTTNTIGGGIKNSAFFIKYALRNNNVEWVFAISPQVEDILCRWGLLKENMYVFDVSPARNKNQRKKLKALVRKHQVDLVYTMAGPAYVDFDAIHVQGISNSYITHADIQGFCIGRSFLDVVKIIFVAAYRIIWARKADYWIFQTKEAQNCFCRRWLIAKNKTKVITTA
jgi:hypothetical protein